ncbi:hypothetical protein P5673_030338 [Acropora cervicornis]|uniref:DUF7869 domain-containing protein n=1 Tax=Acropora cervicornis TaxID=6130 RepID=A0AAD9PU97_ACRCE|nr:hypothetical protein P5673_030338 [Acropora cervicornis]
MADSMPNEQKQHLPSCLTKEKVYRMYEEDMKTLHKDSKRPGYTQFRNMWREHFQHVLIPKVNRFTKLTGKTEILQTPEQSEKDAREIHTNIPHFKVNSKLEGEHAEFLKTHVKLSYLLVGHTHEDVDQMFSRISESLKKEDTTTLKALRILINDSYTPNPSTMYVHNIYDMKSWIRPYVSTFQYHGSPHVFRFTKKMEKVRWKWCSVFWLVTSKRSGYQRKTIRHYERCASWVSNFTETRECQKCDARCYGESY